MWRRGDRLRSATGLVVGLGVQWTPPSRSLPGGAQPRPGTLQLCTGDRCLVFQLAQAGGRVPAALQADTRATFAGYNVGSECQKLRAHHGGLAAAATTLELRRASGMGNASLARMAARLLGIHRGVRKSKKIGTSKWDAASL